jgi:hypothetical protein
MSVIAILYSIPKVELGLSLQSRVDIIVAIADNKAVVIVDSTNIDSRKAEENRKATAVGNIVCEIAKESKGLAKDIEAVRYIDI